MDEAEIERICKNPKFAAPKRKGPKNIRTVKDLFDEVAPEQTFKDKRGRPWVKNPKAYARKKVNNKINEEVSKESSTSGDSDSDTSVSDEDDQSSFDSDDDANIDVAEDIKDLQDIDWYEFTSKNCVPASNSTHRLALMHFDWDNAKPETIYMVLESFLPARGHIEKITIYPSEFGIQHMKEEEINGPPELRAGTNEEADADELMTNQNPSSPLHPSITDVDDKHSWNKASKQLRRRIRDYQLARLKYFFAIIEFDSVQTAEAVYEACDGLEYESSGSRLDLRFVDNDQQFEVPPQYAHLVSECREINKAKYDPVRFETSALHSTRISLTWDKTSTERTEWFTKQFDDDVDPETALTQNADVLGKYLALSSSGSSTAASSDVDAKGPAPTVPRIPRHRPKKLPADEVRKILFGSDTQNKEDGNLKESSNDPKDVDMRSECDDDGDEEEKEEVFDLNDSNSEDYDLGEVEKRISKQKLNSKVKSKLDRKVKRKSLSKYENQDDSPDSSEEEEEEDEEGDGNKSLNSKVSGASRHVNKKKKKLKQKAKMMLNKRKIQARIEKEAKLWHSNSNEDDAIDNDSRFDEFLKNPAFEISQTHQNYKEAIEFVRFIKKRKASLLAGK